MTNKLFAEYATSTAFAVSLSKHQCNLLLRCEQLQQCELTSKPHLDMTLMTVGGLRPLEARGLVFWHRDDKGQANGFGGLTEAGRAMVQVLKLAGLTVEKTNTVSVLARIAREAA